MPVDATSGLVSQIEGHKFLVLNATGSAEFGRWSCRDELRHVLIDAASKWSTRRRYILSLSSRQVYLLFPGMLGKYLSKKKVGAGIATCQNIFTALDVPWSPMDLGVLTEFFKKGDHWFELEAAEKKIAKTLEAVCPSTPTE